MTTFGYIFTLAGVLLMRQVVTGRTKETPEDIKALTVALLNADVDGIRSVVSLRGTNAPVSVGTGSATDTGVSTPNTGFSTGGANADIIREMRRLGTAARGYVWGATGPTYYDCSGLVWRALFNLGLYKGPRFTTSTFAKVAGEFATAVPGTASPQPGDIVLWEGHHIGVLVGPDKLYSARSPSKGIGASSVSQDSSYFKAQPTYWRIKGSSTVKLVKEGTKYQSGYR